MCFSYSRDFFSALSSNDTFLINEDKAKYRNNNIDDYFKGEFTEIPFRIFSDEKTKICQPFVPFNKIDEGQRNWRMLSYLSMHASLNLNCDKEYLMKMSIYMNNKMTPKLHKHEVNTIIRNVLKKIDEGSLKMYCNKERRILINPNMNFTKEEKRQITSREIGNFRTEKTSLLIYKILESWDFEANGKIIQKKVAKKAGCVVGTMKRYWHILRALKKSF